MREWVRTHIVLWCLLLAGLLPGGAGCKQTPEVPPQPLVPPGLTIRTGHFVGTPISGPIARSISSLDLGSPAFVQASFAAVELMPEGILQPITLRTRLVMGSDGRPSVMLAGAVARSVLYGPLDDDQDPLQAALEGEYGQAVLIRSAEAALPRGVTATFCLSYEEASKTRPPEGSGIGVQVYRTGRNDGAPDEIGMALLVEAPLHAAAPGPGAGSAAPPKGSPFPDPPRHALGGAPRLAETAILDAFRADQASRHAFIIPLGSGSSDGAALVVVVETAPGSPDQPSEELTERCRLNLEDSVQQAARQPVAGPPDAPLWPGLASAFGSLQRRCCDRSALAFLAGETGARICGDMALVADGESLGLLAESVIREVEAHPFVADSPSAGWTLERAALNAYAGLLGASKVPPELMAVLTVHTGEVGRRAAFLEELIGSVNSLGELGERLIAQNFILLEDSSPAARVRAFDWLESRGRAPAGYDPLAPMRERRAALAAARDEADAASQRGGSR